ncbi:MAG TPA: outer membrane protein assembly factor BamA [Gemmatimonadaceae bacterium]|jgi:outer membrane protein insertion porin family|nr:outer membrane protein assembly factor BamA [Gemmatimonadaceae bacterium]
MLRPLFVLLTLALVGTPTLARGQAAEPQCITPDSIAVRGNSRIDVTTVVGDAGIFVGDTLNYRMVQRGLRNLYATGQFDDARIVCERGPSGNSILVIEVKERPILGRVDVRGVRALSSRTVRDRASLPLGQPLDPASVATALSRIDSLYEKNGYFLAQVKLDTVRRDGQVDLNLTIDEGRRLAVSAVDIVGNSRLREGVIVDAMETKPEGFFFWQKGEFNEDELAADLGEKLPTLYSDRGYVDFQVTQDTLVVDRDRGKALVRISVDEGKKYRVGRFEVVGNQRFSTEEINRFYPFVNDDPSITERFGRLIGRSTRERGVFSQTDWEEATRNLQTAYANEGYIYAQVTPVIERQNMSDSVPTVNLRWEITERTPAIVNRVDIVGNDYTTEACIREQLVVVPGDVFSQDRIIRSYQNISNMGFFEAPLPPPDTRPANDKGDVDVIFRVRERRTGTINFGASVGQGTGVGGFLGLDQPNLFGQCKRASLQWQFGRYVNDFQLSYTDPAIRRSRISGTASAYHTRSRFIVQDLGRITRTGGSLQFGFPVPRSFFTRFFVSYGGESVKNQGGLFERDTTVEDLDGFRSTLGTTLTRDNRVDLPFATAGGLQTVAAQFNGGFLGGSSSFQRYTTELRTYAPLGQFGGDKPGAQPMKFVLGLTARGGVVFGDVGPFFTTQKFAMGGTQYGEMLRGYEEFSITPQGFLAGDNQNARRSSFGNAFFSATAELGLRFNQMIYVNLFYDAGNVYDRPRQFDPTRLFRGAGVGVALVTPLGPLGLDWAYGFDRLDAAGRPDPKWQLHFRLGNIF